MSYPPPPQIMGPVPLGLMGPQSALGHPGPPVGMAAPPPPLVAAGPPVPPPGLGAQVVTTPGPITPAAMGGTSSQLPPVNPATNDAPLEFNLNKNKPPMPIPGNVTEDNSRRDFEKMNSVEGGGGKDCHERHERHRGRERERGKDRDRDREKERDRSHDSDRGRDKERNRDRMELPKKHNGDDTRSRSMSPSSTSSEPAVILPNSSSSMGSMGPAGSPVPIGPQPAGPNMWSGMMGMGYTMMGMMPGPMMGDPGMMGMSQFGMMGPNMGGIIPGGPPVKEIIHCKSCTLFPPNPNAPPPTTRERPPGCRTVFVGGLPENVTEEIIREIFERCGEITIIRMSKKNFCHIRFELEAYVDNAIYLSGYRIRIGSNTDPPNTGRLHVDYAQARDDLYEWECRQRQLQREQRHRERLEQERLRPPSPPPVVHYTDHEAQSISEKLKGDDTFIKAVQVLITWLERGDCSKRNSNSFYSMVQSSNSHVRRLMNEKGQYEEELQRAKDLMKQRMQGILMQFSQIERVFMAASHQKVWDHFTKAQRKNIDMWKKQAAEIKNMQLEEALNERADEEMEVSDSEEEGIPRKRSKAEEEEEHERNVANLKEENDSLRCQLEAYKNEVDLVRHDLRTEVEQKEKQIKLLQQTLQGLQQQLMEARRKQTEDEQVLRDMERQLATRPLVINQEGTGQGAESPTGDDEPRVDTTESSGRSDRVRITDKEARLLGLISTFLHVHPFGAGLDYIWSYLQRIDSGLRPADIENLMTRFPLVFRQELSGVGASMERRWLFVGFQNNLQPNLNLTCS